MEKKLMMHVKKSKRKQPSQASYTENSVYTMLVFSHLRWGFVYQRPQHLISRMAKSYKILFVEEPVPFEADEENSYTLEIVHRNLHVLKPKVSTIGDLNKVLGPILKDVKIEIGWFYSAAFSPLLTSLNFEKVIYDCMDELTLFKGAPPQLIDQEKFLIAEADVVFTGGKSLYESKRKKHPNVHCFPSSVERGHFEKAKEEITIPADMKNLCKPVVGYYGVIDERIDLALLHKTALLQPQVAFVMIGPLAKIGEDDLPRENNIHYLGMKSYAELPHYLKAIDIAMMPFALNDATRFISPTKTLEYMAAGKPIISTAIKDVQRDYSHCISIIQTAEEFSETIAQLWHVHQPDNSLPYDTILNNTSWDATAHHMMQLLKIGAQ